MEGGGTDRPQRRTLLRTLTFHTNPCPTPQALPPLPSLEAAGGVVTSASGRNVDSSDAKGGSGVWTTSMDEGSAVDWLCVLAEVHDPATGYRGVGYITEV